MDNKWKKIYLLCMAFVMGGVSGFIYEELFYRIDLGYFVKRGTTFGPWIPIYGFGAVGLLLLPQILKKNKILFFLASGALTGTLEYLTGWVLDRFFHTRLWDYNVEIWNWGNINGYVCFRSILLFACCGVVIAYVLEPLLGKWIEKGKKKAVNFTAFVPFSLFVLDIFLSMLLRALHIIV